ncbi:MAG: glycogen synthase GlgA [Candidatus Eisenbacteria bacterium]
MTDPTPQAETTPLRIAFVTSELAPFAKTGGLADVSAALPLELHRLGHDVRLFLPLYPRVRDNARDLRVEEHLREIPLALGPAHYRFSVATASLPGSDLRVNLVDCPALFGRPSIYTSDADEPLRFLLLQRAAIELCQRMGWGPDVFHVNDWQSALVPLLLRTRYRWDRLFANTRTLLTIHNLGYQGTFTRDLLPHLDMGEDAGMLHQDDLREGRVNFLKHGILYADQLSTVSPTYAEEIQTEAYGFGVHEMLRARRADLVGILNGVDYSEWSPQSDRYLPKRYSERSVYRKEKNKVALHEKLGLEYDRDAPVAGIVSRLSYQKGFDLLFETLPALVMQADLRVAVLGSGEPQYEEFFAGLQRRFPGRVCFWRGFNEELAHLIEGGSDLFLMPSRYEPCGLNQMYSLRYGTAPVVRRTGGLADTVQPWNRATGKGTGFVFEHFTSDGMMWAMKRAIECWRDRKSWQVLMKNGMQMDFSWQRQVREYVGLYQRLAGREVTT